MLWQSLGQGFNFIEADIYCFLGQIFVAHDLQQLRPWHTLEKRYLEPLQTYLQQNQMRLYTDDTPLWLFLDVKTPADSSYQTIHKKLKTYSHILTCYEGGSLHQGQINIILSGNRLSYENFSRLPIRYAALDGRAEDLGKNTNPHIMPIISDDWRKHFSWQGQGEMPIEEEKKLNEMLELAHQHGQKLRFWATHDQPDLARTKLWDKLLTAGIDLVNTDDVTGLASYLKDKALTNNC